MLCVTAVLGDYPRYKYRGPPVPKPPPRHFVKKWQPPMRPPLRRPIPGPMQMHKMPQQMSNKPLPAPVPAPSINRPVALSAPLQVQVRPYWKATLPTTRNLPSYPTSAPVLPKKAFQSSPAILAQEYDFHIQSNNIPTPIKTIKQVGEKGPIHTIPAPNLSLADKPLVVKEVMPRQPDQRKEEITSYVQVQKAHSYQVTEPTPDLYQLVNVPAVAVPVPVYQPEYLQLPSQPEYHSFNYEEPKIENKDHSITPGYFVDTEQPNILARNDQQFAQNYYDNSEINKDNDVNPENNDKLNNDASSSDYYVSLPSKETADNLAKLQAAGRINSSLQDGKQPMQIYVPDDSEDDFENDDYSQEDMLSEEINHHNQNFGHRLQPVPN